MEGNAIENKETSELITKERGDCDFYFFNLSSVEGNSSDHLQNDG